jgi:hypothetical protein
MGMSVCSVLFFYHPSHEIGMSVCSVLFFYHPKDDQTGPYIGDLGYAKARRGKGAGGAAAKR